MWVGPKCIGPALRRYQRRLLSLLGLVLLCLVRCSDSSLDDQAAVVPADTEPTLEELGVRLLPMGFNRSGLSAVEMSQVARGSYLVNGAGGGCGCHTTEAGYLAGGAEFPLPFSDVQGFTSVVSRNLTPDPETGMQLSEDEFIETMRTGKDFHDSPAANPHQLLVMPWQVYRFLTRADLQAMYAFLRRIPSVRQAVREAFIPPFPLPPVPAPALGDGDPVNDPDSASRGLRIPQFFASGAAADAFNARFTTAVGRLTSAQQAQVGRGSYLVNALADCNSCHTDGNGDGNFDGGLIPGTNDVNTTAYLAGGVNLGPLFGRGRLFSRNLTPDPSTGLFLSEAQFVETIRFGADFRRPGGSLRVPPHFPADYRLTLDDLKALYAYLRAIPGVVQPVDIVP
jgi:mono/diheme cytochrome c family protein